MQLERQRHGIQRIAITKDDQRFGCNLPQIRRREIHIVIRISKPAGVLQELLKLLGAPHVALAHQLQLDGTEHRF